jgi:hydroxyacylglutathione hydrolase
LLTHGDFDHSGNARYLREKIGGKIDMHQGDKGIVEQDDLFSGRKMNFLMREIGKIILFFLKSRLSKEDRFIPDFYVEEGYDLSDSV